MASHASYASTAARISRMVPVTSARRFARAKRSKAASSVSRSCSCLRTLSLMGRTSPTDLCPLAGDLQDLHGARFRVLAAHRAQLVLIAAPGISLDVRGAQATLVQICAVRSLE